MSETAPTLELQHVALSEDEALRFLDGHRISRGGRTMDPKAQIVGEFVKSIRVPGYYPPLPELRQQLRTRNIDVVETLEPNLPAIWGDRFQLEQVFINLITNARDAMQPLGGGVLTVTTRTVADWVEVGVADTGPGVSAEIRDRIFDPFFTTKEVGQGTGLGLSISYGIICEHGGEIRVVNRPEGGAEFVVRLPICGRAEPRDRDTQARDHP